MRCFDPDEIESAVDSESRPVSPYGLRGEITRRYEGRSLETIIPGEPVANKSGVCYRASSTERAALFRCPKALAQDSLRRALFLIRGIRQRTHSRLVAEGYRTILDLESHPRFGPESCRVRALLEQGEAAALIELCCERLTRSHPLILHLAGFHDDRDFLFLDLETMGLFPGQPVVVAGMAWPETENQVRLEQHLARDFEEEAALITEVCRRVERARVLVTFNGKSFDLPFLEARAAYYGLPFGSNLVHFDLLHFCRRAWRGKLPSCSLGSIEQGILGIGRESDLPGERVPEFYLEYLRSGNPGFLKLIADHNRQDVASLVNLFSTLTQLELPKKT